MAYKSIQEMTDTMKHYDSVIEEIPETFEVHSEYLIDGMTVSDFVAGYKIYHHIIKKLNSDMIASPASFRLIAADKKGIDKPVNMMHYPYLWLFIALALSGEAKNGVLNVNGAEFLEYTKGKVLGSHDTYPRNVETLMNKLPEYGFDVSGYVHSEPNDFTITYKASPYLFPAVKASTFTQYQSKSLVADYACFNVLMFKTAPKEKMPFTDTHAAKYLSPPQIEFITTAISELGKIGLKQMAERHHKHSEGWMKFKAYQIYYSPRGITTLFDIHDLDKNEKYLETLPEKYINLIRDNAKCRGCRKGECGRRYVGELFDKKAVWCNTTRFRFPSEVGDIPYVIDIITNIYGKKKSK